MRRVGDTLSLQTLSVEIGFQKGCEKGVLLRNDGKILGRKERGREPWLDSTKCTSTCMQSVSS